MISLIFVTFGNFGDDNSFFDDAFENAFCLLFMTMSRVSYSANIVHCCAVSVVTVMMLSMTMNRFNG